MSRNKELDNQLVQELDVFLGTELYKLFMQVQAEQYNLAVSTIIDSPVSDMQKFSQREQNIGAAREIQAKKDFFSDLREFYINLNKPQTDVPRN